LSRTKTNEKDFGVFKEEAKLWIDRLLRGWEIAFKHETIGEDLRAWEVDDLPNRIANLGLSIDWSHSDLTHHHLCKAAFHEVWELLLTRLKTLAKDRYIQEKEIDEEVHHIIRTMENLMFEPDYERRICGKKKKTARSK